MLVGKGLLTPLQQGFLRLFAGLPDQEHFFLTGGTALSEFYLGHRLSFDLNLSTSEGDLLLPFSYRVEEAGKSQGLQVRAGRRFASFAELQVSHADEQLQIHLVLDSPFRLEAPIQSEYGVLINGWLDVQVDKLLAYYGRAEPRDALDLYFILQTQALEPILEGAAQKDPGFDLYWFAVALYRAGEWPDEPGRWPVKMLVDWDPRLLKETFEKMAVEMMGRATAAGGPWQTTTNQDNPQGGSHP